MTAVGKMPDVPRNIMPLCSCHLVRLAKNAVFEGNRKERNILLLTHPVRRLFTDAL